MTNPNFEVTVLDQSHAAMEADESNDAARLKFFERLADAELFLLLAEEQKDDVLVPRIFNLEEGPVVLTFDREERLANFAEQTVPYAALSGRMIVGLLAVFLIAPIVEAAVGIDLRISLFSGTSFWLFLAGLVASVTVIAGAYPAFILSRVRPVMALRAGKHRFRSI